MNPVDMFGSIYDNNNSSTHLDIYSLTDDFDRKIIQRTRVYEEVLKKVHTRIKYAASHMDLNCLYAIPEHVIGMPLYNYQRCKTFVINRLVREGFDLKFIFPNILYICWNKVIRAPQISQFPQFSHNLQKNTQLYKNPYNQKNAQQSQFNEDKLLTLQQPAFQNNIISWRDDNKISNHKDYNNESRNPKIIKKNNNKIKYIPSGMFD
jgi:hypothetical protein